MGNERDVALVLSGGGINGILMELGFLQRLRESPFWPRVGCIVGTSAGALAGTLAALDRLDELERFLLALQPGDSFRPNRLWRLPLLGMHDYVLPQTIEARVGSMTDLARELTACPVELVACATDMTETDRPSEGHEYELTYSSRSTPPEELAQAILASAAVSTLVLPLRVGSRIATDGAWARNFPLGHAYNRPEVEAIVAFRFLPQYPRVDLAGLRTLRKRLERFRRVTPIRNLILELREAEAREERGEPPHYVDMIRRLLRVAVFRGTALEERLADEKDDSIRALAQLRADVAALLPDPELARAVDECFAAALFPFRGNRLVPRITVRASAGELGLEGSFRGRDPWAEDAKRALILRGWELTDAELAASGV